MFLTCRWFQEHGIDLLEDLAKSQVKLKIVGMMITIYEALIAFRVGECSKGNQESCRKIKNLFKGYTRSMDFVKLVQ